MEDVVDLIVVLSEVNFLNCMEGIKSFSDKGCVTCSRVKINYRVLFHPFPHPLEMYFFQEIFTIMGRASEIP